MALDYSIPPEILAKELVELSESTTMMITAIRDSNYRFSEDFPGGEITGICEALSELHAGSAEGCKAQLEYARQRLGQIRQQHFISAPGEPPAADEKPVENYRKGGIDNSLSTVLAGILTSLDAYRQAAQDFRDEGTWPEEAAPNEYDDETLELAAQSTALEKQLQSTTSDFREVANRDSKPADNLLRTLKDAENYNRLTRAELGMKVIIIRWLKTLKNYLGDYPKIIRQTASLIKTGVDISEWAANEWTNFQTKVLQATFDGIRDFAQNTHRKAEELENVRRRNREQAKAASREQLEAEAAAKAALLSGERIPPQIVPLVRALEFGARPVAIPNPEEIGQLSELRILSARIIRINNIEWLSSLTRLRSLALIDLLGTDITPLKDLTNLTSVHLGGTQVNDIAPLNGLPILATVDLSGTLVNDVTPLKGLPNLTAVHLSGTQINDITPLKDVTNLTTLRLAETQVSDITP